MAFCKEYNAATADKVGEIVPVVITVYEDRSYSFVTKSPPTASLLLKAIGKEKGSPEGAKGRVGEITVQQLEEIAKIKMPDLLAADLPAAMRTVLGQARNMGIFCDEFDHRSPRQKYVGLEMFDDEE